MSLRDAWEFRYSVAAVLEGARAKLEHHRGRVRFWEQARDGVEAEIADSGVEIKHHEVTGGRRVEAVIDTTLGRRLGECEATLSRHKHLVEAFETWIAVLQSQPAEEELTLDHDDVLYFGLDTSAEPQEAASND